MRISKLRVDIEKADSGAWVDMPDEGEFAGVSLRVRGQHTFDAQRLRRKLEAAVDPKKRRNGQIDPEEADRIDATILHECVLLDWRGIDDDEGNPLPYTKETAADLLLDRHYVAFRSIVRLAADIVLSTGREALEDDKGN